MMFGSLFGPLWGVPGVSHWHDPQAIAQRQHQMEAEIQRQSMLNNAARTYDLQRLEQARLLQNIACPKPKVVVDAPADCIGCGAPRRSGCDCAYCGRE